MKTSRLAAAAALMLAAGACQSDLDPGWLVYRDRVLGARVETAADPRVASPAPGDAAVVRWVMAAPPGAAQDRSWTFVLCPAAPYAGGIESCGGPAFTSFAGRGPSPAVAFEVPPAEALKTTDHLALIGAVCSGGEPSVDPTSGVVSCGGGLVHQVALGIGLASDEPNHNPVLGDDRIAFDGRSWPAPAGDACSEGAAPRVAADGAVHTIELTLRGSDRDTYTTATGNPPRAVSVRESLQLSHFATAGELERQYSVVERNDDRDSTAVSIEWIPPPAEEVPAGGLPVNLTFVVRDLRGGLDAATRTLCVTR